MKCVSLALTMAGSASFNSVNCKQHSACAQEWGGPVPTCEGGDLRVGGNSQMAEGRLQ